MNLFEHGHQIILGTLLGNSKIVTNNKNVCLYMRNKSQQWIESKSHDLKQYEDCLCFNKNVYHWRSKHNELFEYFNNMFYVDGCKIITFDILDHLRDIGISVWYGDCGGLVGRTRSNACLRTQSFGSQGSRVVMDWFNSVGIECNLNKHRDSYVVVFTRKGTNILFNMISILLPSNRRHLLTFY